MLDTETRQSSKSTERKHKSSCEPDIVAIARENFWDESVYSTYDLALELSKFTYIL